MVVEQCGLELIKLKDKIGRKAAESSEEAVSESRREADAVILQVFVKALPSDNKVVVFLLSCHF